MAAVVDSNTTTCLVTPQLDSGDISAPRRPSRHLPIGPQPRDRWNSHNDSSCLTIRFPRSVGQLFKMKLNRGVHSSQLVDRLNRYTSSLFSVDDLVGLIRDIRSKQDQDGIRFADANIEEIISRSAD